MTTTERFWGGHTRGLKQIKGGFEEMQVKVRKNYTFCRGQQRFEEGEIIDVNDQEFKEQEWKLEPIGTKAMSTANVTNRSVRTREAVQK
jgi:hypothetical protein